MFEKYSSRVFISKIDEYKSVVFDFPKKQEDLVGIVIDSFNGRVEEALDAISKVLSGKSKEESTGYNDRYFIIRKDISTAYNDLADSDELDDDGEPEIEEVDIPTLRLKEILEDYIAEKKKLGIE